MTQLARKSNIEIDYASPYWTSRAIRKNEYVKSDKYENLSGEQKSFLLKQFVFEATDCQKCPTQKELKELFRSTKLFRLKDAKDSQDFLQYVKLIREYRWACKMRPDAIPREIYGYIRMQKHRIGKIRKQRELAKKVTDKLALRGKYWALKKYESETKELVLATLNLRVPAHGQLHVSDGQYSYEISKAYAGRYSSRCSYQKIENDIYISLPFSKFRRVPDFLKSQNFLAAKLRKTLDGDVKIYDTVWLKRGRGFNCSIEKCRILTHEEQVYHCSPKETLEQSLRRFAHRRNREAISDILPEYVNMADAVAFLKEVEKGKNTQFDSIKVRRTDSIRAGNCIPGTQEFIAVHQLKARREMSLREFCEQRELNDKYYNEKLRTIAYALKRAYIENKITTDIINPRLSA